MSLKKILKMKKGQSSVEYLILFAIIAMLTILGITTAFPKFRAVGDNLYNNAVRAMH